MHVERFPEAWGIEDGNMKEEEEEAANEYPAPFFLRGHTAPSARAVLQAGRLLFHLEWSRKLKAEENADFCSNE